MPFSPCGMVMDVRRSMALTRIRPFRDNPREVVIRWFPAPSSALAFPSWHQFASSIWERNKWGFPDVGEVQDCGQEWITEMVVPGLVGDHYHGTLDQFQHGAVYDPNANYPYNAFGLPVGCGDNSVPEDDVRDINYWRQQNANLPESWYLAGGPFQVPYDAAIPVTQDTDYLVPYFPSRGDTVQQLGVFLTQLGLAANTARLAIYEAISEVNLAPGELVAETGDISLTLATGINADTVDFEFDRLKLYWIGVNFSDAVGLLLGGVSNGTAQGIFGTDPNTLQGRNGITRARPYGPWPAAYPAITELDIAAVCPCLPFVVYE